jgi:uncharacterized protein (TIGR03435 family)
MLRARASFLAAVILLIAGLARLAPAQSTDATPSTPQSAAFDVADVHVSALQARFPYMEGGDLHGDRFLVRNGTMVDLISTAYHVDEDNIFGGPAWLETDRFDIIAKAPRGTPSDTVKLMLQEVLADRFKLVVHKDSRPMQAFVLTVPKGGKSKLRESAGSDKNGCQAVQQGDAPSGAVGYIAVSCHNMTLDAIADALHDMAGGYLTSPVVNQTGIEGSWDFDLKWTGRGQLAKAGDDGISIFDAVDKQLGLKLEPGKAPLPAIVVDSVNETPTPNSPDVAKMLPPPPPSEFDVAVIKPSAPDKTQMRAELQGGQINVQYASLKFLIFYAWDLNFNDDQEIVNAPKWLNSDHYDITAKANIEAGPDAPQIEQSELQDMLKKLLIERFNIKAHMEERPVSAYTLYADKPKLTKADPSNRTKCKEGPGLDGKDPRIANPVLGRLLTCQNMSMAQFASMLQSQAGGYIYSPVKDATNLQGNWDFTLSFSGIGQLNGGPTAATAPGALAAADPSGALSLPDAISKQLGLKLVKETRPAPVLVIEHVDEQPTDN